MRFYLGTHQPHWLGQTDVPLFVSRRRLAGMRRLPRARGRWALDSGGFSEISLHGRWETSATAYAAEARRFRADIGGMAWAAIQDWMCEPTMLKRTGLTVEEHQERTIRSYIELRELAPEVPWAPVLQGWCNGDYFRHVDAYAAAGVDLHSLTAVGVGSVCRRQNTMSASLLLLELQRLPLDNLHGFGFKMGGLVGLAETAAVIGQPLALASADSMAWSFQARRQPPLYGCTGHKNCANCLAYALDWRARLLGALPPQPAPPEAQPSAAPPAQRGFTW